MKINVFVEVPLNEALPLNLLGQDIHNLYLKDTGKFDGHHHITINYGDIDIAEGDSAKEELLDKIKQEIQTAFAYPSAAVAVISNMVDTFKNEDFTVYRLDVVSPTLSNLHSSLQDLGISNTYGSYHAHVTLGYAPTTCERFAYALTMPIPYTVHISHCKVWFNDEEVATYAIKTLAKDND